jgi:pyruvate kinase
MRKTKIICTLGPATEKSEVLRQLIEQGSDVFRLNMSHATHDWVRKIVPRVRMLAQKAGRSVAVLVDTQGPAIRTGDLETNLHLKPGDILEFTVPGAKSKERYSVDVNYPGFADDVKVGNTILVDNGLIKLLVLDKGRNRVRCKVLTRAILGSRRHINLPGVHVNLPSLTKKDLADVSLGVEMGADFIGLSFVREKSDIEQLRKLLSRKKSKAQIVAKIEDQLAVRSIDKMIESADVIMVARGDLGIECPMEELPIIQRRIVKNCLRLGKPVIIATQLLESMITNPMPTRAEITDVANAVFEQADALMLSGETTIGRYPIECVAWRYGSSAAAGPGMQRGHCLKTFGRKWWLQPSPSRTPCTIRNWWSSLCGEGWRDTLQISGRSAHQSLLSLRVMKFIGNSRFTGGRFPCASISQAVPTRRLRKPRSVCARTGGLGPETAS